MCVDDFYDIFVINRSKRFHAGAKPGVLKPPFSVTCQRWILIHFLYDVQMAPWMRNPQINFLLYFKSRLIQYNAWTTVQ